jgi:hypothetical protein
MNDQRILAYEKEISPSTDISQKKKNFQLGYNILILEILFLKENSRKTFKKLCLCKLAI